MTPPVPPLAQIVEAFIAASEDPIDTDSIVTALHHAVAIQSAEASEENPLPDDWAALEAVGPAAVEEAIAALNQAYQQQGRALAAVRRPRGWKLMTRPEFADFLHGLHPEQRPQRLSPPALETLAIVAYRQPVTKAEIESVRGVSADAMIQKLLDLELVRIGGRAEQPGRPLQYVTTEEFLEHFNLHSTAELPNVVELRRIRLPGAAEVHAGPIPAPAEPAAAAADPGQEPQEAAPEEASATTPSSDPTGPSHTAPGSQPGQEPSPPGT